MTGLRNAAPSTQTLVLYDGVCGLCNRLVTFLLRHDNRDQFLFAPLQSEFARGRLHLHGLNTDDLDTVVVLVDFREPGESALTRSDAILWTIGQLGGVWRFVRIAKTVPFRFRNCAYDFVASRRYRVFGRYDECPLADPKDRHKFV